MTNRTRTFLVFAVALTALSFGCARQEAQTGGSNSAKEPAPTASPGKNFTTADVAKLKWIEGTWRGMDGDKPFYERYKIEESAMVVETLSEDGSLDGESDRFELKNGEFGKGEGDKRSAASEIGDDYIQFVPAVAGKRNSFRFVKQPHGWNAILEWPAADGKTKEQKVYKMEPWSPKK